MKKKFVVHAVSAAVALALAGCGGGGGATTSTGTTNSDGETISSVTSGFALPSEISAVPASADSAVTSSLRGFNGAIRSLARAASGLSATSDYNKTQTKKFVEERALEQFDIIEQVLSAVGQTNYAESDNINAGPYTAMIAWTDDQDGREIKTLEPWVVDSRMIVINGADVNRVLAWIEEPDHDNPGEVRLVKAEFLIYQAATTNADGSFADYGKWDLNVSFDDSGVNYFVASSSIDANDVNTIQVHEKGTGEFGSEMKGILVRSGTEGYGKVSYPDYEACWSGGDNGCDADNPPPVKEAQYAYNTAYLAVDDDTTNGTGDAIYKDRDPANAVEMTHRYGLFYDEAPSAGIVPGANVEKYTSFGFPVAFEANSVSQHAYYGAWQGRHELWGGDPQTGIAAGTTVTRDDHGQNTAAETYVVSAKFNGTLTKRTLVDGSLTDIQNIPVETFINKNYDLRWDNAGSAWKYCEGWLDWQTQPPTCMDFATNNPKAVSTFADFDSLIVAPGDRKFVNIGRWDSSLNGGNGGNVDYVYLKSAPATNGGFFTVAGFYPATFNQQDGSLTPTGGGVYTPSDGDNLWVNVGGSIYIEFNGTSWVQKTLTNFDQQTWTPTFDPNGNIAFQPELGREYYINNQGASFVVKRVATTGTAADDYEVKIELQSAANPVNVASILPTGTSYLATPWQPELRYQLVTDAADSNFMKLVYVTDDPNTNDVNESTTTTVLTDGQWGLQPFNASNEPLDSTGTAVTVDGYGIPQGATRPVEFNWEYSTGGWGTQQFLCSPDCSVAANYKILDNPIMLSPFAIDTDGDSVTDKTLSLQFDGWMHGLPDMYHELAKNNFQMSADISAKVINIPAGTAVTDGTNNYYIKPLEISVFLDVVPSNTAGVPDITSAASVDLGTVPTFTNHGMGAKPTGTVVKYSEGKPVE